METPESLVSETPLQVEPQPKKKRKKARSRLEMVTEKYRKEQGLSGAVMKKTKLQLAANPLRDLQDKMLPAEDGTLTTLTIPIQELSRKQYDTEMMRAARLTGFRRYLETINIEELKAALVRDDGEKALDYLCALLDPDNRHLDPATIAMRQRIPLSDIMAIWRNDRLALTIGHLYEGAPKVAQDAIEAAQNSTVCCSRCDGAGEIRVERKRGPYWITCSTCMGKGEIRKAGDYRAREMVLRATGVVKGGNTGTQITINTGSSAVESVLDELDRLSPPITVHSEPA